MTREQLADTDLGAHMVASRGIARLDNVVTAATERVVIVGTGTTTVTLDTVVTMDTVETMDTVVTMDMVVTTDMVVATVIVVATDMVVTKGIITAAEIVASGPADIAEIARKGTLATVPKDMVATSHKGMEGTPAKTKVQEDPVGIAPTMETRAETTVARVGPAGTEMEEMSPRTGVAGTKGVGTMVAKIKPAVITGRLTRGTSTANRRMTRMQLVRAVQPRGMDGTPSNKTTRETINRLGPRANRSRTRELCPKFWSRCTYYR